MAIVFYGPAVLKSGIMYGQSFVIPTFIIVFMCVQRVLYTTDAYWGTADGLPPLNEPVCGFRDELCPQSTKGLFLIYMTPCKSGLIVIVNWDWLIVTLSV